MLDAATQVVPNATQQAAATAHNRCQAPSGSHPAWCVVATLPKAEQRAHASLHQFGFEAYLPLITIRWRDRTWHTHALFAGYCFVRLDLNRPWSPVRYAPGVFQLLMTDGQPSICPDGAVEALQATEAVRRTLTPPEAVWRPGAACRLDGGGLHGRDGVVMEVGKHNALVTMLLFGHLRTVSVPLDCLRARDE